MMRLLFLSCISLATFTVAGDSLADLALAKVLDDASPVFGLYNNVQNPTSTWMKAYPDKLPIAHMNIPGTHDAATWNYSLATQTSLNHITSLAGIVPQDPTWYRCQRASIVDMLNAGIRVFDLRYAFDVTNSTLVFWHGPGLQSETATVDDVLIGYYKWLDDHPSEAVFLSFQYQGNTQPHGRNDAGVQHLLYTALTSPQSQRYILQTKDHIGTLGEARGKVTLLRRFDFDQSPPSYEATIPGVHFSPASWTDNSPNISLTYNQATGETAYIEDYYQPLTPQGSSLEENIIVKYNATVAHLSMAADTHLNSLFWSFASSNNIENAIPDTPKGQALGNGSVPGVNQRLLPWLKTQRGKRLGIVMFDFFDEPNDLVPTFLSLLPPRKCSRRFAAS